MEKHHSYFLKISGFIPQNKRKEFEQTFRFVFNQLPPDCLAHDLSSDIFSVGYYHFYSLWPSESSLSAFLRSDEFQLLQGIYKTIGITSDKLSGDIVDIKSFHVNKPDNQVNHNSN